eukprot:TRINITY_DN9780_c0_g1_i1.p1 TRINITY_DN9780_c0_g1~~TRINITY_DN9780_c0_g1_i1.p1  ORF type:complete len:272 (-),score=69.84 TRINITY_DN9780_c0_g1_i1:150-965(-)
MICNKSICLTLGIMVVLSSCAAIVVGLMFTDSEKTEDPPKPTNPSIRQKESYKLLLSHGDAIPSEWIVHLKEDYDEKLIQHLKVNRAKRQFFEDATWSIKDVHESDNSTMVLMECDDGGLEDALRSSSLLNETKYVEQNRRYFMTQALPNLDRIDQRALPLNGVFSTGNFDGTGVDIWVLDTGVRTTHMQFEGRATAEFSAVLDGLPASMDCNGHGSHIAGTAAGATVGIARGARIRSGKVLGCDGSGSTYNLISGIRSVIAAKRVSFFST